MKHIVFPILLLSFALSWANAESLNIQQITASVDLIPGWEAAPEKYLAQLSRMTKPSVIAHAKAKDPSVNIADIDSQIILLQMFTKQNRDKPNVMMSIEKIWGDPAGKNGSDYLKLMSDRFSLFSKNNKINHEFRELKINEVTFYAADVTNSINPDAVTKQEYISSVKNNFYVTFVLSYNDKSDSDYDSMMKLVRSYTNLK